jgi:hypothetical protein
VTPRRAVLLPSPGDPYLIGEWLRNFRTWQEHVDALYFLISWPQAEEVEQRIVRDVFAAVPDGKTCLVGSSHARTDHGFALEILLSQAREDEVETVLLMEDDLYVRTPPMIESLFETVESGAADMVGAPRGSMSERLLFASREKWGLRQSAFWPHLFVCSTENLIRAGSIATLNARSWFEGDVVEGLDYTCKQREDADTFGAASFVLRSLGLRAGYTDSTHGFPGCPWFHIGSLSTGPGKQYPDAPDPVDQAADSPDSWASRVAWWERCWRNCAEEGALDLDYWGQIERLKTAVGHERVTAARLRHDALVNW